MAEKSFARIGYVDGGGQFNPTDIRAREVFASNGISVEEHMMETGIHLTAEQAARIAGAIQQSLLGATNGVATLNADGKIPAGQLDLAAYQTAANVETYADMLALTVAQAPENCYIFVADASDDPTVNAGWAAYRRVAINGDAEDYVKVAEGESLDVTFPDWSEALNEAKDAALIADGKASAAQAAADAAQTTANAAQAAASSVESKADGAQAAADAAQTAADAADSKAVAAQTAANAADGKADTAQTAAEAADSKAVAAQTAANAAQTTANAAAAEAALLDFAYCVDEADMASKNLRPGAVVLIAVEND